MEERLNESNIVLFVEIGVLSLEKQRWSHNTDYVKNFVNK